MIGEFYSHHEDMKIYEMSKEVLYYFNVKK